MRTARKGGIEGAVIGEVLVIARGEACFTIPARELESLKTLLDELLAARPTATRPSAGSSLPRPRSLIERSVAGASKPAPTPTPAPVEIPRRPPRPRTLRRGRVWEGVKNLLAANTDPQPFDVLLDLVRARALTERDPEHALRIALGKKVATGELIRTPAGAYALPEGAAAMAVEALIEDPETIAPLSPPRKKRRHRPGELWKQMKAHMASYPEGRTLAELVVAADEGNWTTARDTEHAVKICLSRVGDQIERMDGGRYRLAGLSILDPRPVEMRPSGVRRRRKQAGEAQAAAEAGAEPGQPEPDPEEMIPGPGSPGFDASKHYPTPRSRLPR